MVGVQAIVTVMMVTVQEHLSLEIETLAAVETGETDLGVVRIPDQGDLGGPGAETEVQEEGGPGVVRSPE